MIIADTLRPLLLFAALFSAQTSGPTQAQELGFLLSHGRSAHPDLPRSSGGGVFLGASINEDWAIQATYERVHEDVERPGDVCVRFEPRMGCVQEMVFTSTTLSGTRVSLTRTFQVGGRLRLGLGGGGSFSSITAEALGESGRRADLNDPKTGQLGGLVLATGRLRFSETIPVALWGSVSNHWIAFKACATNPNTHDPYCGASSFRELSLGILLHL